MRAFAPGKLVLTGAYAVLEGAPSIAVAVSRGAFADTARAGASPTPELSAALGVGCAAPHVDASAMFTPAAGSTRKLGLGASAAILVASLAARDADAGADLADPRYREALFTKAREAHARAQGGGSGVDVATSVHGGAVRYVMGEPPRSVMLPAGLTISVFACGTSARTSDLRAQVDRLAHSDAPLHRACMGELVAIANDAARAVQAGNAAGLVDSLRRTARGLDRLGAAAQVAIVPPGFDALEALAAREEASFSVSGAGGGDVAVYVGLASPSARFTERAQALGVVSLSLSLDQKGVRIAPAVSAFAESPYGAS
jgi:phosphomevalonate kinase